MRSHHVVFQALFILFAYVHHLYYVSGTPIYHRDTMCRETQVAILLVTLLYMTRNHYHVLPYYPRT